MSAISPRRLLLTGANGFVGQHVLGAADGSFSTHEIIPAPKGWDLRDADAVRECVDATRPDDVLHLAAQSFVPAAFKDPATTLEINVIGTLNLLKALDESGFKGRMVYVSSADVYGSVAEDALPVDERTPVNPRNPYAVSKLSAEELCLQWWRTFGTDIVIARPFNHIGPGQDDRFVVPSMAKQVMEIKRGQRAPVLDVGDTGTSRDFTDVRDVVAAYALLLSAGRSGERFVIGSGIERSIDSILRRLCTIAGIEPVIRVDTTRFRPGDQKRMVANPAKLRAETGWKQAVPFEKTLQDILTNARK
mgnify:CR=1 FL=1